MKQSRCEDYGLALNSAWSYLERNSEPSVTDLSRDGCSCMEQSSDQCHYSNFPGFLQKTTENISFQKVIPGILVCVPCPRSTFAHVVLICTFLTNY